MNPWQLAQQLRHLLATVRWPAGSQAVVFGERSVLVVAGTPGEDSIPPGFPFALISVGGGEPDPDEPSLLVQAFSVMVVTEAVGDPMGEHAMIGAARPDAGKSAGAGLLEVAERARSAVQKLTGFDGASIVLSASGIEEPLTLGRGRHVAMQRFSCSALCTSQPYYAAPQQMSRTAGILRWRGDHCEERFDFARYRVGWVAGTTPADTPAGTTIVYTGTAHECALTITPGRVYQVFADYSPRGSATPTNSSDAQVGSWVRT